MGALRLIVLGSVLLIVGVPSADAAQRVRSTTVAYPTEVETGDPVAEAGRIWWLTFSARNASAATLRSVATDGRDARRVTLVLPPPLATGGHPRYVADKPYLGVDGDRVTVGRRWLVDRTDALGDETLEPPFAATFVARTGRPLAIVQDPTAPVLLNDGVVLEQRPRTRGPDQVAGRYELRFTGRNGQGEDVLADPTELRNRVPHHGWVRATVVDRRTGRRVYVVGAAGLAHGAGAGRRARIDVRLLPDGSLAVSVRRSSRGSVRPTWVDPAGRRRSLGPPQPRVVAVTASFTGGRGLVSLDDDRRCSAWFVVSRSGRRGAALGPLSRSRSRMPVGWTGDVAVWPATDFWADPSDGLPIALRGRPFFTVDRGLRGLTLTRAGAPGC